VNPLFPFTAYFGVPKEDLPGEAFDGRLKPPPPSAWRAGAAPTDRARRQEERPLQGGNP